MAKPKSLYLTIPKTGQKIKLSELREATIYESIDNKKVLSSRNLLHEFQVLLEDTNNVVPTAEIEGCLLRARSSLIVDSNRYLWERDLDTRSWERTGNEEAVQKVIYSLASARRCRMPFVDPPRAYITVIAFSKA